MTYLPAAGGGDMLAANNLSDVASVSASRTSLGLGSLATQSGTFSGTSSGTNTGDQTTVSGNAGTATALATPRTLNGVSFDGTANVEIDEPTTYAAGTTSTVAAATSRVLVGPVTLDGTFILNGSGACQ